MHSPLKKVLNKLEDSYHPYVNVYKTHAMATHHGGTGKPLEKDSDTQENDTTIHDEYQADISDFKNIEPDHHERLRDWNNEIDHLWQKVKTNETEPMNAINHLEWGSLAASIHHCKREANRCNFDNNVAMIWIS